MRERPLILAVDDAPENLEILRIRLEAQGYAVAEAVDGQQGLDLARELRPDLILLDVMMPKLDGIQVVREIKADPDLRSIGVILVTARADTRDVVEGLDAGGDDYLAKPFEHSALLARVRSMLRQKALHDTVQDQARQLAELNRTLADRVSAQVDEIQRVGRLRRFLPPQVAELIVSESESDSLLQSHRREVTIVFCDLRGFTAFAEATEPEDVMAILREYHACLGELIFRHGGTLERFVGDGLLVLFNDPLPCRDHPARAVRMALEIRERMTALSQGWRRLGHDLGFGIGMAQGYATLGRIGFEGRSDYAAIGATPNLASRLCDQAKPGQILISQRLFASVDGRVATTPIGELVLKGFHRPVPAYEVVRWIGEDEGGWTGGDERAAETAAIGTGAPSTS